MLRHGGRKAKLHAWKWPGRSASCAPDARHCAAGSPLLRWSRRWARCTMDTARWCGKRGQAASAVVTSIFVNPLQFGANEDLSRYPRDEAGDLAILEAAGCHLVWLPDVAVMYPPGDATTIDVAGPAELWEGEARPGHFRGVATRMRQAVRSGASRSGVFRREGLAAVAGGAADGGGPAPAVGHCRCPDGARAGRAGAVLAQPVPDGGGSCRGAATVRRPASHRA